MKNHLYTSVLSALTLFFVFASTIQVKAQCPPGAIPSNFDAVDPALFNETFTASTDEVRIINPTGGGTDQTDIKIWIDAQSSIQLGYNNLVHYYNSVNPALPITGIADNAYNGLAVFSDGVAYYPTRDDMQFGDVFEFDGVSELKGSGTAADPWKVKLRYFKTNEFEITEILTYVAGDKFVRRDRKIVNQKATAMQVYDLRDAAFNQVTDSGFGAYSESGLANGQQNPGGTFNGNPDFIGISNVAIGGMTQPTDVFMGFLEITGSEWINWNTTLYSAPLSVVEVGGNLDNELEASNSDIGFNIQYADVPGNSTVYRSVYEAISSPCTPCPLSNVTVTTSATTGANTCPATTFDVTSLNTTTDPANATLKVFSNSDLSTEVTNPVSASGTYYLAYESTTQTGCFSMPSDAITVTISACASTCPTPTLAITAGDDAPANVICTANGESITLTATAAGTVTNPMYEFSKDGVVVQASSTTATYTVTGAGSAGSYTVKVSGDGCTQSEASTAIVFAEGTAAQCLPTCPVPTLAITSGDNNPANEICNESGEMITVTATADASVVNAMYTFLKDGVVVQGPNTTNTYVISSAGSYTVKVSGDNCLESESDPIVITAGSSSACNVTGSIDPNNTQASGSGGNGTYTYTNVTDDAAKCGAYTGSTNPAPTKVSPGNVVTVDMTTGAITIDDSSLAVGTYYYCIEVCDTSMPTPLCDIVQGEFEVECPAGDKSPILQKN